MARTRRNWLWIILGVFIVLVFVGIGAIIATTAWVQQNLTVTETTEASAIHEFDAVHARFSGRAPLLEMRGGRPVYSAGKPPSTGGATAAVERLHVLVWTEDEQKLVSVAIPMWFLRLKSGPFEFGAYASGWDDERVDLSVEDIERYGPGVILDATSPKGERVLLWAQ
jgi:hypothetical protein